MDKLMQKINIVKRYIKSVSLMLLKSVDVHIIAAYTLITLIFTFPLVFRFTTFIPGNWDAWGWVWNIWWFKFSIINLHTTPYYNNLIFYPNGANLAFTITSLFNEIISIPLQVVFNLIIANNIIVLFTFIASGYGTYLLVRYLTNDAKASFISGLIFAFSAYRLRLMYFGPLDLLSTEFIPLYFLCLIKATKEQHAKRNFIYLVLFFVLVSISNWYYMAFIIIFTAIFICYMIITDRNAIINRNFMKYFILALILIGILMLPVFMPMLEEQPKGYFKKPESIGHSAHLVGFLIPDPYLITDNGNQIIFRIFPQSKEFATNVYKRMRNTVEKNTYIGYSVILLSIYTLIRIKKRKEIGLWVFSSVVFFVLSLGPKFHIIGDEFSNFQVTLPGYFLQYIPLISDLYKPNRMIVILMLSLAVLCGYGLKEFFSRNEFVIEQGIKRKILQKNSIYGIIISLIIILEFINIPIYMTSAQIPTAYKVLPEGDYAILEIPISGNFDLQGFAQMYQYYQSYHHQKIVGGTLARYPENAEEFILNTPVIRQLRYPYFRRDIIDQNLSEIGPTVLNYYNIGYIILHKDWIDYAYPNSSLLVDEFVRKVLDTNTPFYSDYYFTVYEVKKGQNPSVFITLGNNWVESEENTSSRWMKNNATIVIINPTNQTKKGDILLNVSSPYINSPMNVFLNNALIGSYWIKNNQTIILQQIVLMQGENIMSFSSAQECRNPQNVRRENVNYCILFKNISLTLS